MSYRLWLATPTQYSGVSSQRGPRRPAGSFGVETLTGHLSAVALRAMADDRSSAEARRAKADKPNRRTKTALEIIDKTLKFPDSVDEALRHRNFLWVNEWRFWPYYNDGVFERRYLYTYILSCVNYRIDCVS